jgi:tetrahydromethanopterin S-methyltransferase subunit H
MNIWQVLAALGLVVASGVVVWYKVRDTSTDAALSKAATDQANKTADQAEQQLADKAKKDKELLDEQITEVFKLDDAAARAKAAMDLLSKYRGGLH